ncbi:MAG TPA: c-type cytochrome [Burkholderiales bacterium]|jgi:cytochrome c553|nr:c-type cytochrome [Burkholderiales bacterium]
MTLRIPTLCLAAALALGAQAAAAQDKKADAKKAADVNVAMCIGCHGIAGYKTAFPEVFHVPLIAGQNQAYIEAALKAYRAGQRPHPSMRGIAGGLSDEEISAYAKYYAGEPAAGNAQAAQSKIKAAETCAACHGPDGAKTAAPDQPILAGQYADYLVKSLKEYKSGKRTNPIMQGFAAQLSVKEMQDLAAWFASQKSSLHTQR